MAPNKEIVIMADEEEKGQQQESGADTGSSDAEMPAEGQVAETVDWESRAKEYQAAATQAEQKAAEMQEQLDSVTPYVDFGRMHGNTGQGSVEESYGAEEDEEQYMSKKQVDAAIERTKGEVAGQLIAMEFRQKNPDLVQYEQSIVTPAVARLARAHPTWGRDKILDEAVKESRGLIENLRQEGLKKAAEEAQKKKEAVAAASGLGSAGSTPPPKKEPKGETYEDYMARRKQQNRAGRGLI
jgi:hypothetical protein